MEQEDIGYPPKISYSLAFVGMQLQAKWPKSMIENNDGFRRKSSEQSTLGSQANSCHWFAGPTQLSELVRTQLCLVSDTQHSVDQDVRHQHHH